MSGVGLDDVEHLRRGAIFLTEIGELHGATPEQFGAAQGIEFIDLVIELRAGGAIGFRAQFRVPVIEHTLAEFGPQFGLDDVVVDSVEIAGPLDPSLDLEVAAQF